MLRVNRWFAALPVLLLPVFPGRGAVSPHSGSTSFVLQGDRIYAKLAFIRPDGTRYTTLAYVDSGSPSMIVSEALFKELRLDKEKSLTFQIGEMPVQVDAGQVTKDAWLPFSIGNHRKVEALLPAGVMREFQVVIDYRQSKLTLAQPGTLAPEGLPVPFRVNRETGLIVVDVAIDGQIYPMTIDCGSAYTWLRKATARRWLAAHSEWERGVGAVGLSNMRMADDGIEAAGTLLRIPQIQLGALRIPRIGALAIGPGKMNRDFLDWYSRKNPVAVIGWLGGNVLRGFRITLDYPRLTSYWLKQAEPHSHDFDQVGLTLEARAGAYFVSAIATHNGEPTVEGVEVGDKLLQVGGLLTNTATRGEILEALHGTPGDLRVLVVERNGNQITVPARVAAF